MLDSRRSPAEWTLELADGVDLVADAVGVCLDMFRSIADLWSVDNLPDTTAGVSRVRMQPGVWFADSDGSVVVGVAGAPDVSRAGVGRGGTDRHPGRPDRT